MNWEYISNIDGEVLTILAIRDDGAAQRDETGIEEIGYLYAEFDNNVIYIQEVGVADEYRQMGIATGMIDYLISMNKELFDLPISLCYCVDEFTEAFHTLISERRDFVTVENGLEYIFQAKDIYEGELVQKVLSVPTEKRKTILLSELSKYQLGQVFDLLREHKVPFEDDVTEFKKLYDDSLSGVCFDKDNRAEAVVLGSYDEDGVYLNAACTVNPNTKVIALLLKRFFEGLKSHLDKPLLIQAINQNSIGICESFIISGINNVKRNPMIIGTYITDVFGDIGDNDLDIN